LWCDRCADWFPMVCELLRIQRLAGLAWVGTNFAHHALPAGTIKQH